jgi:hypothetical protein
MMILLDPGSSLSVRVALALVFAAAASAKLRAPAAFRETLRDYRLLPRMALPAAALLLPVTEACVAATLPFAAWRLPAVAASSLLLLFGAAMAANLVRGRAQIDCGCSLGAGRRHRLRWHYVARNVVAAAVLLCLSSAVPSAAQMVTGVLGGIALFLVLEAANTLWALEPPGAQARAA